MVLRSSLPRLIPLLVVLALLGLVAASSGDRNPTYQHCLRGCGATYCDPSQPPLAAYLRLFGWTCETDCQYQCAHSFTDNIRAGSRWHQFYGKWPFYRLGPIQEPFSVLMSLGNLYVNLKGLGELRRRVRSENKMRRWLEIAGLVQINTWVWSSVFHTRDTPWTERLDYFSATVTVATSLLYAIIRTLSLQTPLSTSRLVYPIVAALAFLIISHFTYLLSFPLGSFPYGYHTNFVLTLGLTHHVLWALWSLSFKLPYPTLTVLGQKFTYPPPYPPHDPLVTKSRNAGTPISLIGLTCLAMSFELLDFSPLWRVIDAHSLWHACTIPLAVAWWAFFVEDAIELEGALLAARGVSSTGIDTAKMPLTGGPTEYGVGTNGANGYGLMSPNLSARPSMDRSAAPPRTPVFAQLAAMAPPPKGKARSPGRSPRTPGKEGRED